MTRLKTVVHVHTHYSYDSNASCADVLDAARRQGVDCVAITDHDTLEGAWECRELSAEQATAGLRPVRVIVGAEISSTDGHILGLFLREPVPRRLSGEETARRIRAQGGVVLAAHPAAWLCNASLRYAALERLLPWLDGVEVCNAQNPLLWEDRRARRFARRHGIAAFVGADSHVRGHLDGCYQELPDFDGPEGFRRSLQAAELHPGRFAPSYFAVAAVWTVAEKVTDWPFWGRGAAFYRSRRLPSVRVEAAEP